MHQPMEATLLLTVYAVELAWWARAAETEGLGFDTWVLETLGRAAQLAEAQRDSTEGSGSASSAAAPDLSPNR